MEQQHTGDTVPPADHRAKNEPMPKKHGDGPKGHDKRVDEIRSRARMDHEMKHGPPRSGHVKEANSPSHPRHEKDGSDTHKDALKDTYHRGSDEKNDHGKKQDQDPAQWLDIFEDMDNHQQGLVDQALDDLVSAAQKNTGIASKLAFAVPPRSSPSKSVVSPSYSTPMAATSQSVLVSTVYAINTMPGSYPNINYNAIDFTNLGQIGVYTAGASLHGATSPAMLGIQCLAVFLIPFMFFRH